MSTSLSPPLLNPPLSPVVQPLSLLAKSLPLTEHPHVSTPLPHRAIIHQFIPTSFPLSSIHNPPTVTAALRAYHQPFTAWTVAPPFHYLRRVTVRSTCWFRHGLDSRCGLCYGADYYIVSLGQRGSNPTRQPTQTQPQFIRTHTHQTLFPNSNTVEHPIRSNIYHQLFSLQLTREIYILQ